MKEVVFVVNGKEITMLKVKTDIEIAQEANMLPISEIAEKYGILENELEYYGRY